LPTYTVHEPQPVAEDPDERATRLVFVKEGFAWLAFIAPVLWLLFNRLWRELIAFIIVAAILMGLVKLAGGNTIAIGWTSALINLAFGFEARDLYRAALARQAYALIGVVTGRSLEDSERRFLTEWLPGAAGKSAPSPSNRTASMPFMGAGMAHG
jgi:Protein of unknown function (DUF2628)